MSSTKYGSPKVAASGKRASLSKVTPSKSLEKKIERRMNQVLPKVGTSSGLRRPRQLNQKQLGRLSLEEVSKPEDNLHLQD